MMFTGIVTEMGRVDGIERDDAGARITIVAGSTAVGLSVGDSVAVNGACMTAVEVTEGGFGVQVVNESLARTNLGDLTGGVLVNLERPMPAAGRFDGHIVQGHVDGIGTVVSREPDGDAERVRVALDRELGRYVVEKGSITVDGVSLTVTAVGDEAAGDAWFEVALIPHTLGVTVLGERPVGSHVNIEVDILAKYVERLLERR